MGKFTILHVTECFHAGVKAAIISLIESSPEDVSHILLYDGESTASTDDGFDQVIELKKNVLARPLQVLELEKSIKPNIIYAHSSWAGVYTRVLPHTTPIVYQPHCYKFDDPSLSVVKQKFFRVAEKVLTHNTSSLVALTPYEYSLSKKINSKIDIRIIPNVSSLVNVETVEKNRFADETITISMLGRVATQKDPYWFSQVATQKKRIEEVTGKNIHFKWIGSGDLDKTQLLESAGVQVTGWLQPEEVSNELSSSDLYLHSASYEGFPLAVLDAAYLGLPCFVRDLNCYDGTSLVTVDSSQNATDKIIRLLNDTSYRDFVLNSTLDLLETMNPSHQGQSLYDLYQKYGYTGKTA